MKLGRNVSSIRQTGRYVHNDEQRRKKLEDLGFLWRLRTVAKEDDMDGISYEQIYAAIETYKSEYEQDNPTFTIPQPFIVPDCDPWPASTRGLPLGKKVSFMKGTAFTEKNPEVANKIKNYGVVVEQPYSNGVNDSRFQKVFDALKRYKELYGDLLVPQPFLVPSDSSEWPESTWGLRLGARVNAIRSQGTFVNTNPERRRLLDDLGFIWSPPPAERGRKRGRKSKEEIEAEEAQFGIDVEGSSEKDTTESAMESLFGPSFDFGTTEDGAEDGTSWDMEPEEATEKEIEDDPDYKEPKKLSETLKEIAAKAIEVGVIESMG